MEAPERIWGDWTGRDAAFRYTSTCRHLSTDTEYVRADLATARENALREALAEALIPLEVLWCQIAQKPYAELTDDLQAQIGVSVGKGRAALEEK